MFFEIFKIKNILDDLMSWFVKKVLLVWYVKGICLDIGDCFEMIILID